MLLHSGDTHVNKTYTKYNDCKIEQQELYLETMTMLTPEPGSSTLYLSTSVLKYKFQSTWKVLKYISEKYHVLVLELKYI